MNSSAPRASAPLHAETRQGPLVTRTPLATDLRYRVEPLEPRLLLSADWAGGFAPSWTPDAEGLTPDVDLADALNHPLVLEVSAPDTPELLESIDLLALSALHASDNVLVATAVEPGAVSAHGPRVELVVIDAGVEGYEVLLADLQGRSGDAVRYEFHVLDADVNGVRVLSDLLADYVDLDALHVVSHGSAGGVQLGNTLLDASSIDAYADALRSWSRAFADGADLLFYGCELAAGVNGETLLATLGALTGADVAASTDATGYELLGGDWELEYRSGDIESVIAFSAQAQGAWSGLLAGFSVDTYADTVDIAPGDGFALDAAGKTSLRAAIMEANALPGADGIKLPAGSYAITLPAAGDDVGVSGDLDITSELQIFGAGAATTTINGNNFERVFDVHAGASADISGITVLGGGNVSDGGGIRVNVGGELNLTASTVRDNSVAIGTGAGIYNDGALRLSDVSVTGNSSTIGGGVYNNGKASLAQVTISGNSASSGGGLYQAILATGELSLSNVTVSDNTATVGGGLFAREAVTIVNSTFTLNTADNAGGILKTSGAHSVDISNTIVADNTAISANPDVQGTFNSLGFNLIGDKTGSTGLVDGFNGDQVGSNASPLDPMLGGLADNGGPTLTHALLVGSSAIDAGTSSRAPAIDQRGFLRDSRVDIGAFEFSADTSSAGLWISTRGDVAASGAPELPTWESAEILRLANPDLAFGTASDGTWSSVANFEAAVFNDGLVDVVAMHRVASAMTLGGNGFAAIDVAAGDLLLATASNETWKNSGPEPDLVASNNDVVLFHPDTPGDYSSGTFTLLLSDPLGVGINAVSLVEADTQVGPVSGGSFLPAGTFLTVALNASEIRAFTVDDVGAGTTAIRDLSGTPGATTLLLDGPDFGFTSRMSGIELIERDATVGGVSLESGDLLVSLFDSDAAIGNGTPISADKFDVVRIRATATGAASAATAITFLDGNPDVHLDSISEGLDALALASKAPPNAAPVLESAATPILNPVAEDAGSPSLAAGALVSTLVDLNPPAGGLDNVTDTDGGSITGVAITAADTSNGSWHYSIDGGAAWNPLGAVSEASARLLAADANTRIYFEPNADFNGTVTPALTFHAWDRTSGNNGGIADLSSAAKVVDTFSLEAYSNNDGTAAWSSDWVESDFDGGGASNGNIRVNSDELRFDAKQVLDSIYREADLSGAVSATLSFNYDNNNSGNDRFDIEVSGDGGTSWNSLASFTNALNTGSGSKRFDISSFIAADTRVRLLLVSQSGSSTLYVDDLQISYSSTTGGTTAFSTISDTASITVNPINDGPSANIGVIGFGVDEDDSPRNLGGFSVADVDDGGLDLDVTLSVGDGALTLGSTAGLTFSAGANGTATMTVTGTKAGLNAALGTLAYQPDPDFSGNDTVTLQVNDRGNSGSGGAKSDSDSANIAVAPINDEPSFTTLGDQNVDEDSGSHTVVGFASPFAGGGVDEATQTFTYTISGNTNAGLFASGPAIDTNGELSYTLNPNVSGSASITVAVSDSGGTANPGDDDTSPTQTFNIVVTPVNDAPVLSINPRAFINEIHYDNVGGDTGEFVEVAALAGIDLTGWNLVFYNGNGGLVYGTTPLSGIVPDLGAGMGTVTVNLPANGIQNATGGYADGIALVDAGGTVIEFISYEGTLTAVDGPAAGMNSIDIGVAEDGTTLLGHSLQLTGAGATFTWAVAGAETPDAVNTGQDFTAAADALTELVLEDGGALIFSTGNGNAITVTDSDAGVIGDPLRMTLTVAQGTLTLADTLGLTSVADDGTASVSFEGTAAEINVALDGLAYVPTGNFAGSDRLTIMVDDGGNTGFGGPLTDSAHVQINVDPVNDAPVLDPTGTMQLDDVLVDSVNPAGNTVAEIVASAGGDRITDPDAGALEGIAVIGVDDANGTWEYSTDAGVSWISFDASGVADGGTDDAAAVLLVAADRLRFVPDAGYTGSAGDVTFRAWDRTIGSSGDTGVDVSSTGDTNAFSNAVETATLEVDPAAGVNNQLPAAQGLDEDTVLVFSPGTVNAITVSDGTGVDTDLRVTLSVGDGTLTLSATAGLTFVGGADGTSTMTFTGLESAINAALDGLTYAPAGEWNGVATLTVDSELAVVPVALYTFEDPLATGNDDSPGGANDGVPILADPLDDPVRGNVLEFDGVNSHVRIPGMFGEPASLTLAGWVNLKAGFNNGEVISLGNNVGLRVDDTGGGGNDVIGFFYDGGGFHGTYSGISVSGTGWHHVAFTVDTAANEQILYVDGVEAGRTLHTQNISYSIGSDTYLGRHGNGPSYFLNGLLDDVRVYDSALPAEAFTALAADRDASSDSVTITVLSVNDEPSLTLAGDLTVDEDSGPHTLLGFASAMPGGGVDESGQTFTYGVSSNNPGLFALGPAIDASGELTYTLNSNMNGAAIVTVSVKDSGGVANGGDNTSPDQTFTITVNAVNDVPVATGNTVIASEDVPLVIGAGDFDFSDVELDGLASVTITGLNLNGGTLTHSAGAVTVTNGMTVTAAELADLTFTSALNDSTDSSFTYTVNDAGAGVTSAVMNITVNAVNSVPVATGNTVIAAEDVPLVIGAGDFNFTDVELDSLSSVTITALNLNGGTLTHSAGAVSVSNGMTVTAAELADLTFTSALNDSTDSSFTYTVNDAGSGVTSAVMNITVNAVNDVPVATGNTVIASEDVPLVIGPGAFNFTDVELDGLASVTITGLNLNGGTLTHSAGAVTVTNGMIVTAVQLADLTFTSALNDSTDSSFSYTVNDADSGVTSAVMNITVNAVNDVPVATGNTVIANEDVPLVIGAGDFNFTDVELDGLASVTITGLDLNGGTLTHSAGAVTVTNGMSVTAAQLADLTFTSALNDSTDSSFTYTVNDAGAGVTSAVMNITVNAVNDVPVATGNTVIADEDVPLVIGAGAFNFTDVELDGLASVTITALNLNGGTLTHSAGAVTVSNGMTVTAAQLADLTFNSALNDSTDSSFTYAVNDAGSGVTSAVMNITVNAVNDVPVATGNTVIADEDVPLVIGAGAFNFTDVELDGLASVTITALNLNGGTLTHSAGAVTVSNGMTVTAAQLADLTFNSALNDSTDSSFTYAVNDAGSGVTSAVMNITVNAVNDVPVATGNTVIASEDVPLVINAGDFNFTDVELDGLASVTITGLNLNGGTLTHSAGAVTVINGMTVTAAQLADLTFTSALNDSTDSSFTYTVNDAGAGVTSAVMNITVNAVNDVPVATGNTVIASEDVPLVIGPGAFNFTDVELDGLASVTITGLNLNGGTLTHSAGAVTVTNGMIVTAAQLADLTFTSALNDSTDSSFSYTVNDADSGVTSAVMNITVNAVNDVPVATGNTVIAAEDVPLVIGAGDFNFTDVELDSLSSVTITALNLNGGTLAHSAGAVTVTNGMTVSAAQLADLTFTSALNDSTDSSFTYTVNDADSGVTSAVMNITVNAINDEPTFSTLGNQTIIADSGAHSVAGFATALTGGGADEIAQTFSYAVSNDNSALFAVAPTISASGTLTYTLNPGVAGIATVTVSVVDSGGIINGGDDTSSTQTFDIVVALAPVMDPAVPAPTPMPTPLPDSDPEPADPDPDPDPVAAVATTPPDLPLSDAQPAPATPRPAPAPAEDESAAGGQFEPPTLDYANSEGRGRTANATPVLVDPDVDAALIAEEAIADLGSRPDFVTTKASVAMGLDRMRNAADEEIGSRRFELGQSTGVMAGLSVGYVSWLLRGGVLLSSVLSSLPAWRFIDPLPVFSSLQAHTDEDDDDESLEAIVEGGPANEPTTRAESNSTRSLDSPSKPAGSGPIR